MLFRVRIQDRFLGFTWRGKWHLVSRIVRAAAAIACGATVKQERDDRVFAFVNRTRGSLATHATVDRFDRQLSSMSRREGLPTGNLSLARLTRGNGRVQGLLNRLVDRLRVQLQQRTDTCSRCRADVRDVVNLMLVKANAFHQVHLDFIAGCNTTQQIVTVLPTLLCNGQQGRDVVTGV